VAAFLWGVTLVNCQSKPELISHSKVYGFSTQRLERLNNSIIARRKLLHVLAAKAQKTLYGNVPPHPFCLFTFFKAKRCRNKTSTAGPRRELLSSLK
jgi:hypothetical protein